MYREEAVVQHPFLHNCKSWEITSGLVDNSRNIPAFAVKSDTIYPFIFILS